MLHSSSAAGGNEAPSGSFPPIRVQWGTRMGGSESRMLTRWLPQEGALSVFQVGYGSDSDEPVTSREYV
jgi:hypothetical protein